MTRQSVGTCDIHITSKYAAEKETPGRRQGRGEGDELLIELRKGAARDALVVEGDQDVAGAGWCIDGAYQQVQKGAVAVSHAVDWPVIWHEVAPPRLPECVHASSEFLHARITLICAISRRTPIVQDMLTTLEHDGAAQLIAAMVQSECAGIATEATAIMGWAHTQKETWSAPCAQPQRSSGA